MSEGNGLPKGWAEVPLGECGTWYGGGTPSKADDAFWRGGTIPWVSPKDMKADRLTDSEDHITPCALEASSVRLCPAGTVLIVTRSGILSRTLPVAVIDVPATINQDLKGLHPKPFLNSSYLAHLLRARAGRILEKCSKDGTTVASIDTTALHSVPIPLPPLAEQQRIVEKIEESFILLDVAVANLTRAKSNLKRYRASVLKSAVEGRLTEEWRSEHPQTEGGQMLLERILRDRREKWETEQLAKFKQKGEAPPKNWKSKYKEPSAPDATELQPLPEGWVWASLGAIAEVTGGVAKDSKRDSVPGMCDVPYLRVANVQRGRLDLSEVKTIRASPDDIRELRLKNGDVLFNEGGDRDKLGRGWVWREELPECIHQNHVFRARLTSSDMQPCFVSHHGNTFGRDWFTRAGKQTTNLASISLGVLKLFPVPVPSPMEQVQIVALVEERLSQIDAAEKTINAELTRAKRLRQAILKQAFEGKLVPQDPNDEPASVLLERIRATRLQQQPKKKKTRKVRAQ